MKNRSLLAICLTLLLLAAGLVSAEAIQPQGRALVALSLRHDADLDRIEAAGLPMYARLSGPAGDTLILGARPSTVARLQADGLQITLLDPDPTGSSYYVAYRPPGRPEPNWRAYGRMLLNGDQWVLLRCSLSEAERLAAAGARLLALDLTPKPLRPAANPNLIPTLVTPDPLVQQMIDQVDASGLVGQVSGLSGERPVQVDGSAYTIATRYTYSNVPIQKATQYVGEQLEALGLGVEYHQWSGATYPNVIGELTGELDPDEIYIFCAHLDDMPPGPLAPGADDNASGSAAVLMAADILSQYRWGSTLRFALWTGEEQGLWGSLAYAQRAYQNGEDIVGVVNLDMIGYNTIGSQPELDLHATAAIPASRSLANLFASVVNAYGLNLVPQVFPYGIGASDHAAFWQYGYNAILAIEDDDDFNPHYHTTSDRLAYLDKFYLSDMTRASLATFVHLNNSLLTGRSGALDGVVTDAITVVPIAGASVRMQGPATRVYTTTTSLTGHYTQTLFAGTYTITVQATGYHAQSLGAVTVVTGQLTTQNTTLQPILGPQILVAPPTVSVTLQPGSAVTAQILISNTGDAPLAFSLVEEPAVDWLSLAPVSGTVVAGSSQPVWPWLDSAGLTPAIYTTTLAIDSNDDSNPRVWVPLTLRVASYGIYLPLCLDPN